jgi:hypothetical protein
MFVIYMFMVGLVVCECLVIFVCLFLDWKSLISFFVGETVTRHLQELISL